MALSINIKNSLLLITEKVIILGAAFLTNVLIARLGGVDIFGQFAFVTSFTSLFSPLCIMGLNNIATKYFIKYPKHQHNHFLTALLLRFLGAIFSIIIGVTSAYLMEVEGEKFYFIVMLLFFQSFTIFYLIEYYYLAKKQVIYTLKIRLSVVLIASTAKVISILNDMDLLVIVLIHGLEFVAIGLSYLTLYYRQLGKNQKQLKPYINKKGVLNLFYKGKWLLFSGIAAILYLKIDQVMLAQMQGVKQVAFYAAAAKLSEFWYVFPILIANAYTPKLFELKKLNQKDYKSFILTMLSVMIATALTVSVLTYIIANPLINFIYGDNYQASAQILSIHIFASLFIFQRAILSKWLIIEGNYKFSLLSHGAGALSNICLNLLLIPLYGGVGAAWATLLSYMVASFLSLALHKQTREFMKLMIIAMIKWPYILNKIKFSSN